MSSFIYNRALKVKDIIKQLSIKNLPAMINKAAEGSLDMAEMLHVVAYATQEGYTFDERRMCTPPTKFICDFMEHKMNFDDDLTIYYNNWEWWEDEYKTRVYYKVTVASDFKSWNQEKQAAVME